MSALEEGSEPMKDMTSNRNPRSSSMECCLELLNQQGLKSPMNQHEVDEQYSENFLPEFYHLLPEALLQDQARSHVLVEEQNMVQQVSCGLAIVLWRVQRLQRIFESVYMS